MPNLKALINISIPGAFGQLLAEVDCSVHLRDHPSMKFITKILDSNKIEHEFVDSIAGWGNLNQDWLEFTCDIETSWSWCKLLFLTEKEWLIVWNMLLHGDIIMMVNYIKEEDGKKTYVPHH